MISGGAPVSVIIPCYRCTQTIKRAVVSVAAQTFRPAEVILVDDHSGDDTIGVLHALSNQYPTGWIKVIALRKNGGSGAARNAGWELASQDFIAFLDADDAWHPNKIEVQYRWMVAHPSIALTGHACCVVKGDEDEVDNLRHSPGKIVFNPVSPLQLLLTNRFPTPSVMLHRNLPHRFTQGKRHSEDFLLWCEVCLDGHACARSEEALAYLYKAEYGADGLSGDLWRMEKGELDNYWRLRRTGRIGSIAWAVLSLLSGVKYVRRLFVSTLREWL